MENKPTRFLTSPGEVSVRAALANENLEPGETRLTALVTGATDGIGEAVSRRLAGIVDTLLVHGRCPRLLAALAATLAPANPGTSIVPVAADLSSFTEVRRMTQSLRDTFDHLDVLVHNAGTAGHHRHMLTEDANELTFQVNYLSPALLTAELFDLLRAAGRSRIVNVVCDLYRHVKDVNHNSSDERRYHPIAAYAQSKFALAVHTASLARAVAGSDCSVVCLDPGAADTKLRRKLNSSPGNSLAEAADNVLYAVTMPRKPEGFYLRAKSLVPPEPEVLQAWVQGKLDQVTEKLLDRRLPWLVGSPAATSFV